MQTENQKNIQVDSLGSSQYTIKPIENVCQKSINSTEWHIKSGSGGMNIELEFQGEACHLHLERR